MAHFFAENIDFFIFLYGAALFVLAAFAAAPRSDQTPALSWQWLTGFAILHGLHEWLGLAIRTLPDPPHFAINLTLLAASFLFLLEFGRQSLEITRLRWLGRPWWYLALLVIAAYRARNGATEAETVARVFLGLPAAWLSAAGLFHAARRAAGAPRKALIAASLFMALYGAGAGAPAIPARTGYAALFHSEIWQQIMDVPVEVPLTVFVVGLAFCVWLFATINTPVIQLELRKRPPLRMKTTLAAMIVVAISTWFATELIGRAASRAFHRALLERALSIASLLDQTMLVTLRTTPREETHPIVKETEQLLARAKHASRDIASVYLFALRGGKLVQFARSETVLHDDREWETVGPEDYRFFAMGEPYTYGPIHRREGRWISAVVPALTDAETGRVRLALGVDISADSYERMLARWRLAAMAAGGLLILLILDFFTRHYRLWVSAVRLAEAEQQQRALSVDLEQRVRQRTQELAQSNDALRAEIEKHQEAERKYRSLTDQLPAITYRVELGPASHTSFISPQVHDILGFTPEEWMADPELWLRQVHENDRSRIRETINAHDTSGRPLNFEFRIYDRSGRLHWIRGGNRYQTDAAGRPVSAHGVMLDITDQVKSAQQLQEAGERYRLLFEHSPAGLFHYDQTLHITNLNDRFAALLQRPRGELTGVDLVSIADASLLTTLQSALSGGEGYHEGACSFSSLGPDSWVSVRTAPLLSGGGTVVGGIAIVQDLSEQRRIDEERMRTQKLESLGLLAGGLAHDFNNILTAILGNISIARQSAGTEGDLQESLQDAENAAYRAQELTRQLLTFAKGGAPIKQLHDIAAVIREAASFTVRGSASRCVYKLAADTWKAEIDSGQITQVVQNLILNADQAMPDGGIITLETRNRDIAENEIQRLAAGRYVEVSVSDTGVGIPERLLGRIFDPYFTTKQKGSGLGLTMCFSIIQKHSGHILVESAVGRGTTFTFFLPASASSTPLPRPAPIPANAMKGTGRILVMDDERPILQLCRRILENAGYTVLTADRGEEAIRIFDEETAAGRRIDLAILDITVPGGLGGRETLRLLRQRDPGLRALVSSGYAQDEALAQFKKAGFSGTVPKPYRSEDLLFAVHRALALEETPHG